MDQIIHTFGIDGKLITVQLVNFGILCAALAYFLYTPLMKLIDERVKIAERSLQDAHEAAEAKANAAAEKEHIISAAVHEAREIVKRGTEAGKKEKDEIIRDAHIQSAYIVDDAEKKAHARAREIETQSEKEIVRTALLAAEKILKERA